MNTNHLAVLAAMACASLCAAQRPMTPKMPVIVCTETDQQVLMGVRPLAWAMFASIDVRIDWRDEDSCPVGVGAVQVRLTLDPAGPRNPEALAFSRLPDGKHFLYSYGSGDPASDGTYFASLDGKERRRVVGGSTFAM